jgi:hypothetical protein
MKYFEPPFRDWLTLTEAVDFFNQRRVRPVSSSDILKFGYLDFVGVEHLPIYAVAKAQGLIEAIDYNAIGPGFRPLSTTEKALVFQPILPGSIFRLRPNTVESLVLLNCVNTADVPAPITSVVTYREALPDWHRFVSEHDGNEYWGAEFECSISPHVTIHSDDVRIDRPQLDDYIEALKASDLESDGPLAGPTPEGTPKSAGTDHLATKEELIEAFGCNPKMFDDVRKIKKLSEARKVTGRGTANSISSLYDPYLIAEYLPGSRYGNGITMATAISALEEFFPRRYAEIENYLNV